MNMVLLDRIPDQVGYLVLAEDGAVVASGGELENGEYVANIMSGLISLTDRLGHEEEGFKKLSITYKESSYIACLSNKKIYIVKKRFDSQLPASGDVAASPENNTVED